MYKKVRKMPTLRQLKYPVVFFRSKRVPNAGVGFDQTLTRFGNGWAGFEESEVRWLNGVQCAPFTGTKFQMRHNEQLPLAADDYIAMGSRMFKVISYKVLDEEQRRFCLVTTREDPSMSSVDYMTDPARVAVVVTPPAKTESPQTASKHNPYF